METTKKLQGFATLTKEQRTEISRKGGLAISQNRNHMAEISKKGTAKRKAIKERQGAFTGAKNV